MNLMKKIKTFFSLKWKTKLLLLEAFICLGRARFLKGMPFSKIAPSLGESSKETTYTADIEHKVILKNIRSAIQIISPYTFWESQCLVKAIAGQKMLKRRHIDSTLYLGTAKDESGNLIAHAWLRSGSFYVSGSEGMGRFTVVAKFAKVVQMKNLEGENYG
ncbi:stage V sporulation protein S [Virgibacillus phasianinus]|uniref:Stage V sporulation protein S n=1 Tax=Virgibacillus phasianinus TaxID=2017483 RepID=A0A220U6G2_9BACI|nr:lasso peptide biosynthesis B2 protein [Virgibacillus phasianinus]ASK63709.1 stage V sporulation protein S [Virgibacillus phasianinus]